MKNKHQTVGTVQQANQQIMKTVPKSKLLTYIYIFVGSMLLAFFVFCFCLSSSCGPYIASFSGLSIFIAPSVFSSVYSALFKLHFVDYLV